MILRIGILFFLCTLLACSSPPVASTKGQVSKSPQPKTSPTKSITNNHHILLLGLDGIGFKTFKKMQEGGYFRSFRPVAPMVASFPSISDPNWAKIMRTPLEVSFTKEHFDRELREGKGEMKGGLMDHVFHPPGYESYFDYRPEGALQHLASMTYSETSGLYWLDALEKKLLEETKKKIFTAFIVNTDFIAHTKGEMGILHYLRELDRKIIQLRERFFKNFGEKLEVVLVSDHGNVFLKPKAVDVDKVLQEDSWKLGEELKSDGDVVMVVPEILSFAPFFSRKGQEAKLAKSLSRVEGVHVALYLTGPFQVDFLAQNGRSHTRAQFDFKKSTVSYHVLKGEDPFQQIQYFKNGALNLNKYFQETLNDEYPNAIVRGFEGLTQNSLQKPSVLVSPLLGYVFSNKTLELITKILGLESVHGSFQREESQGIFVSTDRDLPPVYPGIVLDYIN